jgi:hypothetical protein
MPIFLTVTDIFGDPQASGALSKVDHNTHRYLRLADLCERPDLAGDELHHHLFRQGGIRAVVQRLCEVGGSQLYGLGFSAGGTALWRAVAEGLKLRAVICVSSTRLRYENSPLPIPTYVFWGALDLHRPDDAWNETIPTQAQIYPEMGHDFYRADWRKETSMLRRDIGMLLD